MLTQEPIAPTFGEFIITPGVGRKVHFRPHPQDHTLNNIDRDAPREIQQPMDATILYAYDARTVNLMVHDHMGKQRPLTSVILRQPDDAMPSYGGYAEWMPAQVEQERQARAAKAIPAPTSTYPQSFGVDMGRETLPQVVGTLGDSQVTLIPPDTSRPGANVHGLGPDTAAGGDQPQGTAS